MHDLCNKVLMTMLKVLGFCTPMTFMACYGPPPSAGMTEAANEELVLEDDSTEVSEVEIIDSMIQQQQ